MNTKDEDKFLYRIKRGHKNKSRKYRGVNTRTIRGFETRILSILKKKDLVKEIVCIIKTRRKGIRIKTIILTSKGDDACKGIYLRIKKYEKYKKTITI